MPEMKTLNLFGTVYEVVDSEARDNAAAVIEDYLKDNPIDAVKGADGEDGGYYTPTVTQTNSTTMTISFAPSKAGMPSVTNATIDLPVNTNTGTSSGGGLTYGKLVVFGDSIAAGYANNNYSFVNVLQESGKFTSVVNRAVSGSTIGPYSPYTEANGYSLVEQIERYQSDVRGADVIICEYEGNDMQAMVNGSIYPGTIDDSSTTTTVCGYTKKAIARIYSLNPSARIIWLPIIRNNFDWLVAAHSGNYDLADAWTFFEATVLRIAAQNSCTIVSLYGGYNISNYLIDSAHVNTAGHKRMAEKILHNMFVETDFKPITRILKGDQTNGFNSSFRNILYLLRAGASVPLHFTTQYGIDIMFHVSSFDDGSICFDSVVSYDNNVGLKVNRIVWKSDGSISNVEKTL
jgi:lysophospholipase L1-like esterase